MFKLESYITPILLSYVNRYISNLKPEDSQVSLWGGDATFHNLELNLQVLEQELQLPFSFVSGSIRELCIHVPWTKLTSEPITITINTIECILNLKGKNPTSDASAQAKINKTKKPVGKDVEAPQGYVQLLINKIVSNIRIHCNNLILKYVEEDIVLSMNVKHLKYQSANKKWEAAYTDLSPTEVTLRKIITVNDLTLCLDKRNASGKIEVYQEPMLYRCSMTMHLLKHYHSTSAKRASTTRLDIYCNNMEFSMTEQQVPMLLRLLMLLYALQQKKLKPEKQTDGQGTSDSAGAIDDSEIKESWTGWAWSYVSAVLPAPWEEEDNTEDLESPGGHTLHLCIYVDTASVTFKVSESSAVERGTLYPQKKMRYNPMLVLKLQGLYTETVIHGMKWFNAMGGIGQAVLLPVGPCSCGEVEITDEKHPSNYLEIGSPTSVHKKDSLFDGNAEENKGNKRKYNRSWDYHMTVFTEAVLLERTPAFAFDYLYQLEVPSDTSSDILSDFGSDYEFSNFTERCATRVCLGPLRLRVCSGLLHRGAALRVAASHYDYPPYYATPTATADTHARDLRSPAPEEVDALRQFVPQRNVRITLFAPILELELMDHPFFQPVKGSLLTRKKKVSMTNVPAATSGGRVNLPKVTIECQFLDVTITYPMYANRVVHATCQLPDAPKKLFDACFTRKTVKVVGLCSRLLIGRKHTTILTPSSLSYCCNAILLPHYWMNPNIPHNEITFESESVTLNATNAKMMVIVTIISKLIMMDSDGATKIINTTTMLLDACKDYGFPYMELYIEGIRYKRVVTNATTSMDMSLGSIKAFIFEKVDASSAVKSKKAIASEDIQQVLFLSGPEAKSGESAATSTASRTKLKNKRGTEETPLLTVTFQYPLSPENQRHAPILLFNLQEIRICVDPLLCKWLLYHPRQIVKAGKSDFQLMKKISKPPPPAPLTTNATSASEASGGGGALDTPRRLVGVSSQSVHSSLDREPIRGGGGGPPPPFSTGSAHGRKEELAPHVDLQEKVYNVLRKWFEVWKGVYLCGDVSQCTVYFPLVSLSAVGSQGIQEAVELAVNKEQPPELMVITLPFATVRSSHRHQQQQQSEMKKYLRTLPVTVPDHVWTPKSSSLPWTVHVADLSCYTVQHGNKLTFLKPVSLSATIGLSTKPPKVDSVSGGGRGASGGGGGAGSSRGGKTKGSDIGYLGICVHIDMTPILVSTSEVQVYLFASILYGLMEVATNLMPKRRERGGGGPPPKMADVIPSQVVANNGKSGSSAVSPSTAHKDHTFLDSNSDKSSSLSAAKKKPDATAATAADSDHIKLTAWVQWTITRFTIELLSNECQSLPENDDLESQQPRLKLVVDAEDIVSSLDLQSVYLKIKSKIGSASIQHFKRSGAKWKPGPFSGTVMRLREDVPSSSSGEQQQQERHDDQGGGGVGGVGGNGGGGGSGGGGFICVTITRASCQHTHTLWGAGVGAGAAQHASKRADKKAGVAPPTVDVTAAAMLPPSKYITEIVVNVQPIDFVISLRTLRSFYLVLAPLLEIPLSSSSSSEPVPLTSAAAAAQASPSAVLLQTVNSQALPLAYLDCRHIRLVMPSVELGATGVGARAQHDVIIFQVEKISLAPSAVNPICRTPIRQDIYDQAVHARILNIPGSEVEDRQYQLDVCGMRIATGTWQDMDAVFSPSGSVASPLHSLSENPAVEWNNLDSRGGAHPCFQRPPASIMNLWNVTERFDISVVAAPAILYRSHVIVCGHSLEINFVSDIVVNLSLNQIKLVSAILSEFVSLVEPLLLLDDSAIARPKIIFPYSRFEPSLDEIDEWEAAAAMVGAAAIVGGVADSGIDTSDIRSVPSSSKTALTASDHHLTYAKKHSSTLNMVYTAAPVDVLFTAGKIGLSLYQIDDDGDDVSDEARPPSSVYKQHRKKKRPSSYRVDHDHDFDDDKGYDAEEESAEDGPPKMYKPLVFVMVKQPNVFLSKQAAGRRMQVSWYDVNVKLRGPEYLPVGNVPTEDDYPIGLVETRCGQPHPNTGILPAFFTLKYVKPTITNNKQGGAHLDVEIAKPTKLLCSMSTWSYLLIIRDRLVDTFRRTDKSVVAAKKRENDDVSGISHAKRKAGTNARFQELKETLRSVNTANLRCGQIVFEFKSDAGHEVNLALEKITANLTLFNRPEKVSVVCGLHSVTLNVVSDRFRKILLNPWTVTFDVAMFWESWQTAESKPQMQVCVESECIMLDVSPEQIRCVQSVLKDVAEFVSSFHAPEEEEDRASGRRSSSRPVSPPLPAKKGNAATAADKEQHYKDDLRAGAFQFVDANTDNVLELPMPYQVAFWSKASLCAMAWRYPQPRALTKVRVFPVPYKTGSGPSSQEDLLVLCHLEYWSECRSCYLPYTHFYLSESEVCHLTLPEATPKTVVASTWRVVITTTTSATETDGEQKESEQRQHRRRRSTNSESAQAQALISPRALAACMRVDSYFDRSLVPNVTAALYLTKIELALYTHFDKQLPLKLPDCLKTYTPDFLFPDTQRFLSVVLENLTSYSVCWDRDVLTVEVSAALKCNVLDYMYLTEQSLVDPFTFKMDLSLAADALNCNLICKPIQIKVGPTVGHTLAVSSQLWSHSYGRQQHQQQEQESEGGRRELVVMTRYVVCNDTNAPVRFGQTGTDEAILLPSRCFHLYAWRSQRKKEHLKLALDDHGWTRSFSVARDAVHTVTVDSDNSLTVIVTVKSLSATQKQVIFSGQLIVSNTLLEHFDLKVVEEVPKDSKESEFKNSPTYVVTGKSNTCSIFISNRKNYFLRLRFYGLDAAWTGDIPLREHATGSQPWLVKVPLQERGQFLSIWCRVIVQEVNRAKRTLAVLWPLFSVKSNLPISSNVHIETPTLNVHLDSLVKGRGELQQLYCPGTIDHSHQLTFRIDNSDPIASPYVPLNYSLVDHQQFFKKPELEEGATIEDILKEVSGGGSGGGESTASWPYFGDELDDVDWIVGEQPLTHVQVKYQASCRYSCSLLVELVPWCLTVNTLGVPITINVGAGAAATDAVQLCKIHHYGIVAPPKLEENFNIGVCSGGTWCYTEPLQLAKSDWSQSFYMPKFTGTIPLEGCVRSAIVCDGHVCMLSLASTINNDIRLLKVSSTHVLSNHMAMQVQVICLAVPDEESKFDIPVNMDRYCFTVAPHLDKSKCGISVIRWHTLTNSGRKSKSRAAGGAGGGGGGGGTNYALYMSFSLGGDHWSCPIRVDKPLLRKSFAVRTGEGCSVPVVLTSQDCKGGGGGGGQIYLTLHEDDAPQLFIENTTGTALYVAQATGVGAGGNDVKVAEECEHFRWRCRVGNMERAYYTTPGVSDKFPDLPPAPASTGASGAGGSTAAAASWAASSTAAAASDGFGDRIAIASEPDGDGPPTDQLRWSNALTLRHDNDQFLRIPYYGDIRVRVANTACTTIVLLESVSQVEISARDIRVRLLMQEITNGSAATAAAAKKINGTSSEPGAGAGGAGRKRAARTDREDSAGVSRCQSDTSMIADTTDRQTTASSPPLLLPDDRRSSSHTATRGWSETDVSALSGSAKEMIERPLAVRDGCTSLTFNAFVKSLALVFVSDVQFDDKEKWELMSLVCDDLVCRAVQVESLKLKITASDVQLDNQLYARESYDFPVVVVGQAGQEKRHPHRLTTLNVPIDSLIEDCDQNALLVLEFTLETWCDKYRNTRVTAVRSVKIIVNPLSCYIEDIYVTRLMEYFNTLTPNVLVMLPKQKSEVKFNVPAGSVCVPEVVSLQCAMLAKPLTVRNVLIAPISLLLSVHSSIKLYIALDQSPLQFGRFERKRLLTTPYRLGHALTMHYLSGAIFGAGWVVSSLELLGSPGGLARAMGTGLRDFVSLPCRGIFVGPMAFLRGITQGSASLMRHITAGTLQSVTKLASSVARNLDRLTLDEEHLKRTEEQRRQRPQGLAQGFMQGLTGLGISLLGAVGGIAHHPLQSMIADGASPRSLAAGVGLGLVGIVTKPLSGAAELVALTGQGLLQGAGWSSLPEPRSYPQAYKVEYAPNSTLKYSWKHVQGLGVGARMLFALEATSVVDGTVHDAVALILTTDALLVVNLDRDDAVTVFALADLHVVSPSSPARSDDPTVLRLRLAKPPPPAPAPPPPPPTTQQQGQQGQPDKTEEDFPMEMDPVSRARVADYVKSTVSLLNLQDGSVDHSEISISPLSSPGLAQVPSDEDATCFTYYVSPQNRNYFVYLMKLAKLQLHNYSFPVL